MKTILGTFAGLVLVAALAGYFILVPHLEKQYADQVAVAIDALPGELTADSIKAELLGGKVTILGLNGPTTYIDGSEVHVDVERITLSGLNYSALKEPGVARVADGIEAVDGTIQVQTGVEGMEQALSQNITFEKIALNDLTGDVLALSELMRSDASRTQIIDCLAGFSIGHAQASGYSNEADSIVGPMTMSMESFNARNMSLLSTGESAWTDIRITVVGTEFLSIGRMGLANCSVPNFFAPLFEAQENGTEEDLGEEIIALMEKTPFVFNGLTLEDISFKFMRPEALTVSKIFTDVYVAADRFSVKKRVEKLSVPVDLYRNLSLEAAQFAEYYAKPLLLDGSLVLDVTQKDGKGDILLKECTVSDPALAFLSLTLDMPYESESVDRLFAEGADVLLRKGAIVLEDKGFLANLFAGEFEAIKAFGLEEEGLNSAEVMRAYAVQLLRSEAEKVDNDFRKSGLEGLAQLVEAPGRLSISVSPDQPVRMDIETDANLNAKVEYEAAQ